MKKLLFASLSIILVLSACKQEDQREIDRDLIVQYLSDNNQEAEEHSSGLFYRVDVQGNNEHPSDTASVTVAYTGYLLDGTVFDQTPQDTTRTFPLEFLIPGWQIGIPLLSKGGSGTFLIPSYLGYGSFPPPGIPANAVLLFEIELVDFED